MELIRIAKVSKTAGITGIIAFTFIMGIVSCISNPNNEANKKSRIEAPHKENIPSVIKYKQVENDRYSFSFEIPDDWLASDKSDNGDGFFISGYVSVEPVDMRIFGAHTSLMDAEKHDKVKVFKFADGSEGKQFEDPDNFIVERYKGDDYVIFSVQSENKEWISSNRGLLEKIAKSIKLN